MKKLLSLILVVLLAVGALFALTACYTQQIGSEEDWDKAIEETTKAISEGSFTMTLTSTTNGKSETPDYNTTEKESSKTTAKLVVDADKLTAYAKVKIVEKTNRKSDNGNYTEKTTSVIESYVEVANNEVIEYYREKDDTSKYTWRVYDREKYDTKQEAEEAFRDGIGSMIGRHFTLSVLIRYDYKDFKLDGGKYVHNESNEGQFTKVEQTISFKFANGKVNYISNEGTFTYSEEEGSSTSTQKAVLKIKYKGSVRIPSNVSKLKNVKES